MSAIVILMGSVMQKSHYEHARRLFRNHVETNERARAVLEDMSLDPLVSAGTAGRFGPL